MRATSVTVLVLGDLGRSPRIVNHALALAESGVEVSLAGYDETPFASHPRIRICPIRSGRRAPDGASRMRFALSSLGRGAGLALQVLALLGRTPRPAAVLVQNPPSLPTLPLAWLAARLRGARLIIDWHNFGYSMLALRLGPRHFAVRAAKAIERFFGCRADAHFCVSNAMRDVLERDFGVRASVLYDRPRTIRPALPLAERNAAAASLLARYGVSVPPDAAIVVCPTSWTADEDMDLLLDAVAHWNGPPIVLLVTGRGPRRAAFEQKPHGEIRTLFLDAAYYPELLRAAHVGISLHRSASGVDLPMKIVDLFAARTPVCALDYGPCLREQIDPGRTGLLFQTSVELAQCLREILSPERLEAMERAIEQSWTVDWRDEWRKIAAPILLPPE